MAGARRILSIAAGVSIADDRGGRRAVRRRRAGDAEHAGARRPGRVGDRRRPTAGDDDLAWASAILGAVGIVERVDERHLDAVTALTGSGPAYLFLVAEALIDAGVLAGLPGRWRRPDDAAVRRVGGAARRARRPAALRAMVTSPGGTTAAGLQVLEAHAVRGRLRRGGGRGRRAQRRARRSDVRGTL